MAIPLVEPQRWVQLLQILDTAARESWIEPYIKYIADLPVLIYPIFLVIWYLLSSKQSKDKNNIHKNEALSIFTATIVSFLLHFAVKPFVDKDRPETALDYANAILDHIPDISFPSGHASVWWAMAFAALYRWYINENKTLLRIWYVLFVVVIIMSLARIAWWIHWPTDIIAGLILSASVTLFICFPTIDKLLRQNLFVHLINLQEHIFSTIWLTKKK